MKLDSKTIMLSLRLNRKYIGELDKIAKATGIRRSELINRAITTFVHRHDDPIFAAYSQAIDDLKKAENI